MLPVTLCLTYDHGLVAFFRFRSDNVELIVRTYDSGDMLLHDISPICWWFGVATIYCVHWRLSNAHQCHCVHRHYTSVHPEQRLGRATCVCVCVYGWLSPPITHTLTHTHTRSLEHVSMLRRRDATNYARPLSPLWLNCRHLSWHSPRTDRMA